MATPRLTKRVIDSLQPSSAGDFFVWDAELKGFGIRVRPGGRKVFVLGYRPLGSRQARRVTLGAYGALTVEQARTIAKKHLGRIAEGEDPSTERRHAREAPTVRELGEAYLADVDARRKPSTASEYRRLWAKHVAPALGGHVVTRVSTAEVSKLHRAMRQTPYLANRVLALVRAFFSFAGREGVTARHENPALGIPLYAEHERERFLSQAEFARLGAALSQAEREGLPPAPQYRRTAQSPATLKHRPKTADEPIPANPMAVAAIRLLAFTGCRLREVLSLMWEDVDLQHGLLRLRDTKTGKSVRHLGAPALDLIAHLPRLDDSPYVFPGIKPGQHISTVNRLWTAVCHAAGLSEVRLHDLRHSFASGAAQGGDSLLVIRSLLGHKDVATTQRYAHLGDDPVKSAADRASGKIASWMGGDETPVTPLRRGGRA